MNDVAAWLQSCGLERLTDLFAENEIDGEVLPDLTDDDLKEIGVTLGVRKKLLKAIAQLRTSAPTSSPEDPDNKGPHARPTTHVAERRQLTVLFCDLVGSTELSAKLDPEEMRELFREYQDTCAGVVSRFGGFVAKFMGDGVLAYFGYPRAYEDAAERAVNAGLALTEAVARQKSPSNQPLAARVGISTGVVIVGDLIGEGASQEQPVVGETPNLAARLQSIAEPGAVVISATTQQIIGAMFEVKDVGAHQFKGFANPLQAWSVLGAGRAEGRFEAQHSAGLAPLVGREQELALLLDRWELAKSGEGQVVLLSGEGGIGKSRLTQALRERIDKEPHSRVRYFCSPSHVSSALHPVIEQLERAAGFDRQDSNETRLDKLEALIGEANGEVSAIAPLFTTLLSLDDGERYPALDLSPHEQKTRTFEALLSQMEGLAAHQPVLIILEDAHWLDPTTRELFDLAVHRLQNLRTFLVVTSRPGFVPQWTGFAHVTLLSLNRLSRRQGAAIVERISGGRLLPEEVVEQILAKTDGVPLFVEELTKTVLESGLLVEAGDHYSLTGPLPSLAIPSTLQDSLMSRLDRLASVKEVAQIASVVGREFLHRLLAAVIDQPEPDIVSALDRLSEAELVFRRGDPPDATYSFKHALVQDAAYQSLLRSAREIWHRKIAETIESGFPQIATNEPEIVAHHLTEAREFAKGEQYWDRAGRIAVGRSANLEAIYDFEQALHCIGQLPASQERDRRELDLQIAIAVPLASSHGYAHETVRAAYARAQQLSVVLEDDSRVFPIVYGLVRTQMIGGDYAEAQRNAEQLGRISARTGLAIHRAAAARSMGSTLFYLGDLSGALRHLEALEATDLSDAERRDALSYDVVDLKVAGAAYFGWVHFLQGRADQARSASAEAIALADETGHGFSRALARAFAAWTLEFCGDGEACCEQAEALIKLARDHGFGFWMGWAEIMAAVAKGGPHARERLATGLSKWQETGSRLGLGYFLWLDALAKFEAGDDAAAREALSGALKQSADSGENWWRPEMLRLNARLEWADAEQSFDLLHQALDAAQQMTADALALRAATDLVERGAPRTVDLLARLAADVSAGGETADTARARRVLGARELRLFKGSN